MPFRYKEQNRVISAIKTGVHRINPNCQKFYRRVLIRFFLMYPKTRSPFYNLKTNKMDCENLKKYLLMGCLNDPRFMLSGQLQQGRMSAKEHA